MNPLDENQIAQLTGITKLRAQASILNQLNAANQKREQCRQDLLAANVALGEAIAECVAFDISFTIIGNCIGLSKERARQLYRESGLWR